MTLGAVDTRSVRLPDDADLLLAIFASTRESDLRLLRLSGALSGSGSDAFLRMQFDAQSRHYGASYPNACDLIITVSDRPAGRILVDESATEILIIDLALLPEYRGIGVGAKLVRRMFESADANQLAIRCYVGTQSDARAFWDHLGFEELGSTGAHLMMERACETSPL